MLVLKRNTHQGVTIDVNGVTIHIVVVECHSDDVRLGFDAPPEVKIWRDELLPVAARPTTLPPGADTRKRGA